MGHIRLIMRVPFRTLRHLAVVYSPLSNWKPVHSSYSETIWFQEDSMLSVRPNRPERPMT